MAGAGFAGSVIAERLARVHGKRVLVVDRQAGILVHRYGPHIFHANSRDVFEYLSRFTRWRRYEHRGLACVEGKLVPIPINLTTVNAVFHLSLETPREVERLLASEAEPVPRVRTPEDVVAGKAAPGVHFMGRLATYRYYNMDQIVAQALAVAARLAG